MTKPREVIQNTHDQKKRVKRIKLARELTITVKAQKHLAES
ncbi:hypothetical protein FOXG_20623 [Fusarium oxysporum f. sp. lycopersici 4287]|uniref:Uncharacterized protein n=1 Tax=Fusarium oxysporum f. sp. lycopersici (strain 4287 / CBS 123668 / FGSC 9935 / NRRL 34936) TaxID=426428 RepID=A0A0J9WRB6_FUSO4|nr:hypothetical protein FOXG_20623 [Fusarium oxysporum f. sp. lycopersici 4287]KNB12247.1 hypothetical protein FOXG_20623 [Fusarium oxysporum f. sp. lycopersici 4287]